MPPPWLALLLLLQTSHDQAALSSRYPLATHLKAPRFFHWPTIDGEQTTLD